MKKICLTKGLFTKVDDDDYEIVSKFSWYAGQYYRVGESRPYRTCAVRQGPGRVTIFLHRQIMNPPKGMQIDHRNGDTLDNRKTNLRICNNRQNQMNVGPKRNNRSGYKGVVKSKVKNKKWKAQIAIDGKNKILGHFNSKKSAAMMYNQYAKTFFGEFARLNKID